jgi:hypothetical protein
VRPGLRKFTLTAHVTSSVGWAGAVTSFLALSIAGLTSRDPDHVRAAYVAMNLIGAFIIVPLCFGSLLTGLIQSLGTQWGLFRYYWIAVKFTLTIGATFLLLLHQFTAVKGAANRVSRTAPGILPDVGSLGTQLVGDAALAILLLLVATTLSVYKPWGKTPYGQRLDQREQLGVAVLDSNQERRLGLKLLLVVIAVAVVSFAIWHIMSGGVAAHMQ